MHLLIMLSCILFKQGEVVTLMQSLAYNTLILDSDKSKEVILLINFQPIPLVFLGMMHILTMSLSFPVYYVLKKGGISLSLNMLPPSLGMVVKQLA
jgi:hypothetical protein